MLLKELEINVFGKVVMCLGDSLGQHLWVGFKVGVGVSRQKCRHYSCGFDEMRSVCSKKNYL